MLSKLLQRKWYLKLLVFASHLPYRLFDHLSMKALNPSSRHTVYKILDTFVANYRAGQETLCPILSY